MSIADIVLGILVLLGAVSGYREGFLMELIAVTAIILGVFCGFKLMGEGIILLHDKFNADESVLPYLSFILIFIIIVVLVRLLGKVVKNSIDKTFLGSVDQLMGGVLGAFKTLFLLSIVIWITDSLGISPKTEWTNGSWLYPFTALLAPRTADWIGGFIPVFKEIFRQF